MKSFYLSMLCSAVLLASCDTSNDGSSDGLQLTGDTPKEIVVKADENGNQQAVTFKAVAPWTATVKEVTSRSENAEGPEWIKLSAYSGEAGDVSLSLSLSKNMTGVIRKAEIIITCGESTITITIEQKAENANGVIIKKIKELHYEQIYNSEKRENPDLEFGKTISEFTYDERGRVSGMKITGDNGATSECTFDYNIVDEVSVSVRHSDSQEMTKAFITLDNNGNAVNVKAKEGNNDFNDVVHLGYTEDGRLGRITFPEGYYEEEDDEEIYSLSYENGYLTKIKNETVTVDSDIIFDIPKFYPNKYPNNCMIDMFSFFGITSGFDYVFIIGKGGKTSDYIIEGMVSSSSGSDELLPDYNDPVPVSDYTPGQIIEKNAETTIATSFNEDFASVECEFDSDKNLSKLTKSLKYEVVKKYYDRVVTSDIYNINGIDYYQTRYKLADTEKIDEGYDYDIYTIKY